MDGPEHADQSDELELQVSDVRSDVTPSDLAPAGLPFAPRRVFPRHVGTVAAVLALAVVVAASPGLRAPALALLLGPQATPTATLQPVVRGTATTDLAPAPGSPLRWQPTAALPDTLNSTSGSFNLAVAPSDGRIAYACDVSPLPSGAPSPEGETSQFWVTQDRGAHWSPVLAISEQPNATVCTIAIDALDPSIVVLAASSSADLSQLPSGEPVPNQTVSEVTFDGGATWQRLAGNQLIQQPTTVRGVTFALRQTQPTQASSAPITFGLAMSRDQMRTWTPLDAAIRATSPQVQVLHFWVNPTTGALLAEADTNGVFPRLWSSADTGQHWRELPSTVGSAPGSQWVYVVVQPPVGVAPWHICASTLDQGDANANSVICSADGGATWTVPIPYPALGRGETGKLPDTTANLGVTLATDGALLLTAAATNAYGGSPVDVVLYRLPAGATRWQTLGPVPAPGVRYATGPGAGILWAERPGPGQPGLPWFYAQGPVFTASYP